jgi:hypothetical protein
MLNNNDLNSNKNEFQSQDHDHQGNWKKMIKNNCQVSLNTVGLI